MRRPLSALALFAACASPLPPTAPTASASSAPETQGPIVDAIASANPKLEECRDSAVKRDAHLKGQLALRILVAPSGKVASVELARRTLLDDALVDCVKVALLSLTLPPDSQPYEIVKAYTFLGEPDVWPTARDGGAP